MALLDIQAMNAARDSKDQRCCHGSELSLLLCDSSVSYTFCL